MIWALEFYTPFLESGSAPYVRLFFPDIKNNIIFLLGKARARSFILHLRQNNYLPNFTDLPCEKMWPHIKKLHLWET